MKIKGYPPAGYADELLKVLCRVAQNPARLHEFLLDLLTPAEYRDIALRWQILKGLHREITQRAIAKKLGVSIVKVTRGSRVLLNPHNALRSALAKV